MFKTQIKKLKFGFFIAVLVHCSVGFSQSKPQLIDEIVNNVNSGQCDKAESSARTNFVNDTTVYLLLGLNEVYCKKNKRAGIEYFKIGARQGDAIAADMLIKLGETPPDVMNTSKAKESLAKQNCLENARERLCHIGCLGERGNAIMACTQNCSERERVNAAACNGIYIPPPQQIIIQQGNGDPNPFPNMNKCIKDGGTLMCR